MRFGYLAILISFSVYSQNIDVNNDFEYSSIRYLILNNNIQSNYSLNIRPINSNNISENYQKKYSTIFKTKNEKINFKFLGLDYFTEYNSNHPYNRNNGTMIPNKGYQHIISPGFFLKLGPLSIKFKPEHHYSENKVFPGFWEGHYPEIWSERYELWNHIDMPEMHGNKRHNETYLGQSSLRLNWKNISIGISNENIWWGPSIRNGIMMSNHARGFKHITLNTVKPIKTFFGNIEWQIITGRLENSGYTPPRTDYQYAGRKLYIPKVNQLSNTNDWRYLQGFILSYSPKIIDGLSFGIIRWAQSYSALVEGKYWWMEGKPTYFPAFRNLFRKNDKYENFEAQIDQAAGIFMKWIWQDSKTEIYAEFHHNDAKQNIRDLILDSDHSRATTVGIQKIFSIKNSSYLFNWEWTQMEQSASRLIREAGSWYEHPYVFHGFTNRGEVLGSSIGPGSNSHYISMSKVNFNERIGIGFEVIDNDNDFYHVAFSSSEDFRRYWKDINFHLNFQKKFKNFSVSSNLVFIKSLNYQWEIDDKALPYYHPGNDVNNLHLNLKITYFGNW